MLGLHFVLGVILARPLFGHTTTRCRARLPVAQPFRGLMTTQQRRRLGIVSELVLGGRGMGCSLCRPPRSRLTLMASR